MATICVGPSATGNGLGADWSNLKAWSGTPSRGDTWYLVDGSYTGKTFSVAASGTTVITIKKATVADHGGVSTGWSDALGDGQSTFSGAINFTTRYWVFDGAAGGGPATTKSGWTAGYGFKVTETSSDPVLFVQGSGLGGTGGNVTISHVEAVGAGNNGTGGGTGNDALQVYNPSGPVTISHCYLHDLGRTVFYLRNTSSTILTVEYVYTGQYESTSGEHSEMIVMHGAASLIFRWGIVTHEEGTGAFISGDDSDDAVAEIYGNVFYDSQEFGQWDGGNNGFFASDSSGSAANWKIFNNTFIGFPSNLICYNDTNFTGTNLTQNNYYYACADNPDGFGTVSHNHWQNSGSGSGTNKTTGTGDPFSNYTGYDFSLVSNTTSGTSLSSPYNVDMFGNTRSSWTRGAIEFAEEAPPTITVDSLSVTTMTVG